MSAKGIDIERKLIKIVYVLRREIVGTVQKFLLSCQYIHLNQ